MIQTMLLAFFSWKWSFELFHKILLFILFKGCNDSREVSRENPVPLDQNVDQCYGGKRSLSVCFLLYMSLSERLIQGCNLKSVTGMIEIECSGHLLTTFILRRIGIVAVKNCISIRDFGFRWPVLTATIVWHVKASCVFYVKIRTVWWPSLKLSFTIPYWTGDWLTVSIFRFCSRILFTKRYFDLIFL